MPFSKLFSPDSIAKSSICCSELANITPSFVLLGWEEINQLSQTLSYIHARSPTEKDSSQTSNREPTIIFTLIFTSNSQSLHKYLIYDTHHLWFPLSHFVFVPKIIKINTKIYIELSFAFGTVIYGVRQLLSRGVVNMNFSVYRLIQSLTISGCILQN